MTQREFLGLPQQLEGPAPPVRVKQVFRIPVLEVDPDPLPPYHPLLALPNAFITPHVAGAMGNELVRLSELAVQEVERFVAGEPPLYPVRAEDLDRIA